MTHHNVNKHKPPIRSAADGTKYEIVNTSITIRSADKSSKDVGDFSTARKAAASVYSPNRTRLYDIYEDILLDGHLIGIIEKRIAYIINKELYFEKGKERVEAMQTLLVSRKFRKLLREILLTQAWGISGFEFIIGSGFNYNLIPRKHIKPEGEIIALEQNGDTGIAYKEVWNLWVIGEEDDLGFLLKCSPYALYKRGLLADTAQYIEIFGQPVRVIKYDAYDPASSKEIDKALEESGGALVLKIPKQAEFEMLDGKQSNGTGELQDRWRMAMNDEMSVIVLGNTETTTSSRSSGYAQVKEHARQQLEVNKSDMVYVLDMLNSPEFINILKSYGYPVDGGQFMFSKQFDFETVKEQVHIINSIKESGTPVSDDHIYAVTGIPKPVNYSQLKVECMEETLHETSAKNMQTSSGWQSMLQRLKKFL